MQECFRTIQVSKSVCWACLSAFLLVVSFIVGSLKAQPAPPPRGITVDAKLVRWKDGDTAVAIVEMEVDLRIIDCWSPETRTRDLEEKAKGLAAKEYVKLLAPEGSTVRIHVPTQKKLGKAITFGRFLGKVWIPREGGEWLNIGEKMVEEGHATKEKVRR